jgi:hypothetical protein
LLLWERERWNIAMIINPRQSLHWVRIRRARLSSARLNLTIQFNLQPADHLIASALGDILSGQSTDILDRDRLTDWLYVKHSVNLLWLCQVIGPWYLLKSWGILEDGSGQLMSQTFLILQRKLLLTLFQVQTCRACIYNGCIHGGMLA